MCLRVGRRRRDSRGCFIFGIRMHSSNDSIQVPALYSMGTGISVLSYYLVEFKWRVSCQSPQPQVPVRVSAEPQLSSQHCCKRASTDAEPKGKKGWTAEWIGKTQRLGCMIFHFIEMKKD